MFSYSGISFIADAPASVPVLPSHLRLAVQAIYRKHNYFVAMSISVAIKASYKIGESPHWEENSQSLLYVDMGSNEVHKWNSITGEDTKIGLGKYSFIAPV